MTEENNKNGNDNQKKETPQDHLVETQHSIVINGEEIHYTVTTGTIVLKEEGTPREEKEEGYKPKAQIFFIAYTRNDVEDRSKRPVTFSFNGGPGSSSVWLHLGLLLRLCHQPLVAGAGQLGVVAGRRGGALHLDEPRLHLQQRPRRRPFVRDVV